ncbi:MAG: response regulator [Pseudomonadota bacterium]
MKKILLVDNNKVIVHLLSTFLRQNGYLVASAEDGLGALELLDSFRPDVMIVDLIMPRINGEKLCRIIRKMPEYDSLFIVIVSAIAAEEKIDFSGFGADACIAKGPARIMEENLTTVLDYFLSERKGELTKKIFGEENIFEREITKELLATKKHLEITMSHLDEGLLEINDENRIIFVNPAVVNLFHCPEEKILAARFPDFFQGNDKNRIRETISTLDSEIVELGESEPFFLHGKFLLLKFVPFFDRGEKYIVVMVHDITRRKQAELDLLSHKEYLEDMVRERTATLEETNVELEEALCKVKTLSGLLPICANCKKIRDDKGYWNQIELFIRDHSFAEFSHGICPDCVRKLYPELDIFGDDRR